MRRRSAFTLIELLVVISIIVVLIGLAFPAYQGVQDAARKTQAKNDLVQIVMAINAYYAEYGRYPALNSSYDPDVATSDSDDYFADDDANNDRLFSVLRPSTNDPNDNVIKKGNSRAIPFLSPPIAKTATAPKNGIGANGRFYDPWGSCYRIRIDSNYSNFLENPYSSNAGFAEIGTGVIAWSLGKDKDGAQDKTRGGDKNAGKSKDDIISWQ